MRIRSLRLYYWNDQPNFGDMLGPFIVERLSGIPVEHRHVRGVRRFLVGLKFSVKAFLRGDIKCAIIRLLESKQILCTCGSILGWGNKHTVFWGSGFMNETDEFRRGQVVAVRGELSKQKLGKNVPIGDPAILLPLLVSPSLLIEGRIGIIPHWSNYSLGDFKPSNHLLIDVRRVDIEKIVQEITSCGLIFSSSLHGLIVAHSYGIPAVWLAKENQSDGFKYRDYFSSVGIPPYSPVSIDVLQGIDSIESFVSHNRNILLPHCKIENLQDGLLRCAPFPLLDKFQQVC